MAKAVLDEIGRRLKLVTELKNRLADENTKEVQELQPLFEKGLWIFGPEFETIEYTSNEGMTQVVQKLYKQKEGSGSRNRPDFAILPDGTCGLYAYWIWLLVIRNVPTRVRSRLLLPVFDTSNYRRRRCVH